MRNLPRKGAGQNSPAAAPSSGTPDQATAPARFFTCTCKGSKLRQAHRLQRHGCTDLHTGGLCAWSVFRRTRAVPDLPNAVSMGHGRPLGPLRDTAGPEGRRCAISGVLSLCDP